MGISSSKYELANGWEREYSRTGNDFRQYINMVYDSTMNK